jgi:hypothetical protein
MVRLSSRRIVVILFCLAFVTIVSIVYQGSLSLASAHADDARPQELLPAVSATPTPMHQATPTEQQGQPGPMNTHQPSAPVVTPGVTVVHDASSNSGPGTSFGKNIQQNALYANTDNQLWIVDPAAHSSTNIGFFNFTHTNDIAFSGSSLYGATLGGYTLISINPDTAAGTRIGQIGYAVYGLAGDSNGNLYASGALGELLSINKTTGAGSVIGYLGSDLLHASDLAFRADGVLFASLMRKGYMNDWLAIVNPSTGAATLIGDTGFQDVDGISFKDGVLYGSAWGHQIIQIDTQTGRGTLLFTDSSSYWGMSTSSGGGQVQVTSVSTTDSSGTPKTAFNAGDALGMVIYAANSTGGQAGITLDWDVFDPANNKLPALSYDGYQTTIDPGTTGWLYVLTIPGDAAPGIYSLRGTVTYNGNSTSQAAAFTIGDTQPPIAYWLSPVGNDQVYSAAAGAVNLEVFAADASGIQRVEFTRWDAVNLVNIPLGTDYSFPYQSSVSVSALNMGWNEIDAVVADHAGNQANISIWIDRVATGQDSWTLMYYIAEDNDLDGVLPAQLSLLGKASSNPNVNIVAFVDSRSAGAYYMSFSPGGGTAVAKGELDTGNPDTLRNFVLWAHENYPAIHYSLTIVGHGQGHTGVAMDENAPGGNSECIYNGKKHSCLTLLGLRQALSSVGKLDIIEMDACTMGTLEAAYQLRGLTDFYVASEEKMKTAISPNWLALGHTGKVGDVDITIPAITANTSPEQLAIAKAQSYYLIANNGHIPGTISVGRMANLSDVVTRTSVLASLLKSRMSELHDTIKGIKTDVQYFNSEGLILKSKDLVDLYHFAQLVKLRVSQPDIQMATDQLMTAVDGYIIGEGSYATNWGNGTLYWYGNTQYEFHEENAHGVSIFFPNYSRSFYKANWLDFAAGTEWNINSLSVKTAEDTIEWGPMLVEYVRQTDPYTLDDPNPPALIPPYISPWQIYLPLVIKH